MFGKYFDNRVHQHFVHTYSRVPYLDIQIFDIETAILKQSTRIKKRTDRANTGIERTRLKSEQLSKTLKDSRVKRQEKDRSFIADLSNSQQACLEKEKTSWQQFTADRSNKKQIYLKQQIYLTNKLKSNSNKAANRLIDLRRWD